MISNGSFNGRLEKRGSKSQIGEPVNKGVISTTCHCATSELGGGTNEGWGCKLESPQEQRGWNSEKKGERE